MARLNSSASVKELRMRELADVYLTQFLGTEYRCDAVSQQHNNSLTFFICYTDVENEQTPVVGRINVNPAMAAVQPLTAEQLCEIRECAAWEKARRKGELARNADGYILRHQARRLARRWISAQLGMNFSVTGGIFVPLAAPIWQFAIAFHLEDLRLDPLGTMDVNALSGEVNPLSKTQLKTLEERVHAIVRYQELATAA